VTLADKAWTDAQEANQSKDKEHKKTIRAKIVAYGTGAIGDPGIVWVDVRASEGLEEDDFRGAIASVEGDSYLRFVQHNTSTRSWMASPLWGTPGNPTIGGYVTLDLLHPEAMAELSAAGVGQVYLLPPVIIDGETSCNYAPFRSGLGNNFCGTASVSG